MTVRETSILAYRQIMAEGLLSKKREEAYHAMFMHGPCTSGEAMRHMHVTRAEQTRARFTELSQMGVLAEVGERDCAVSGRKCIVWEVTNRLPKKLPKRVTATDRERARIAWRLREIWENVTPAIDTVKAVHELILELEQ